MKKKNGFVFVETIVVSAVLAASLVAIYSAFVLIINNQKRRAHYNQSIYNYRSYYAVKSIENPLKCQSIELSPDIENSFEIENMWVVKDNQLTYLETDDEYLKDYIKTIDTSLYPDSCLYLFEYANKNKNDKIKSNYSMVYVKLGD